MAGNVQEFRPKPADTKKSRSILVMSTFGHVDLMVQEGFYSNRTDFIRTAIRNQLERHADVVKQSTARKSLDLGLRNYSREDLEAAQRAGEMLHIKGSGSCKYRPGRHTELARATIASFPCWVPCTPVRGQGRSCRQDEVKTMLNQDTFREATRLTQCGPTGEATALLQRMLRGERAPDATPRTPGRISLPGREPPTIDAKANDVEETDRAHPAQAPSAPPRGLQPLFDRAKDGSWLGVRGVKRTPPATSDIVPEGARFIEDTYSNPAGSRAYKLFVPSRYQGNRFPGRDASRLHPVAGRFWPAGTRMNFIAEEQTCFVVYPAQRQ